MPFNKIRNRLRSFERDIYKVIGETFREEQDIVIDLNTEDQLFERGIDSNDESLGRYSPTTIFLKKLEGQPTDRVTLKDTGSFYEGWFIRVERDRVIFSSRDSKTNELVDRYGADIFGLTEENLEDFAINYILPKLIERFRNAS